MPKYGLARKFEIFDFDTGESKTVIARPSAWYQAALYEDSHRDEDVPDSVSGTIGVYVWAYFAIKCNGMLGEYCLPEELDRDVLLVMMDRFAVNIETLGDEDAPLAFRRVK